MVFVLENQTQIYSEAENETPIAPNFPLGMIKFILSYLSITSLLKQ